MEVMFSENRGHSVYCGVDKPLILLFPACLFDMEFEFLHAVRTVHWDSQLPGRGSLTGPWHVKPTCPKPSSFVFLPDLLLQEAQGIPNRIHARDSQIDESLKMLKDKEKSLKQKEEKQLVICKVNHNKINNCLLNRNSGDKK